MRRIIENIEDDDLPPYYYDRFQQTVEIRRQKREEEFEKKRSIFGSKRIHGEGHEAQKMVKCENVEGGTGGQEQPSENYSWQDVEQLLSDVNSFQPEKTIPALRSIKTIIKEITPQDLTQLLKRDIIPILMAKLIKKEHKKNINLQVQLLICLGLLSEQEDVKPCLEIVKLDGANIMLGIISGEEGVRFLPITANILGNLCFQNEDVRDQILSTNVVKIIEEMYSNQQISQQTMENVCYFLTTLCKGHPPPKTKEVRPIIHFICRWIKQGKIKQIKELSQIMWALDVHSPFQITSPIFKQDIIGTFIRMGLTASANNMFKIPLFRLLGNISRGTKNCVDYMINKDIFKLTHHNINSSSRVIRRQCYWLLGNLIADSMDNIGVMFKQKMLFQDILGRFNDQEEEEYGRIQLAYFVRNFFARTYLQADIQQGLIQFGVLESFLMLLRSKDENVVIHAMKALRQILQFSQNAKKMREEKIYKKKEELSIMAGALLANKGVDLLQLLQGHKNKEIYTMAIDILTEFYQLQQSPREEEAL